MGIKHQLSNYIHSLSALCRYPHTFGFANGKAVSAGKVNWVNETYDLLSDEMQQLGYKTHMLGKWHLGFCHPGITPLGRGFDTFYGFMLGAHSSYATHLKGKMYDWWDGDKIDWSAKVNACFAPDIFFQ